jgi:hypothetical protein
MIISRLAPAVALLVAACVAPSQPFLDQARAGCLAGDRFQCSNVPTLQSQMNAEHAQQSRQVAAGILLGLGAAAAGAAAGYAASHPTYYYTPVVVCRGWYC